MINIIRKILNLGPAMNYRSLMNEGAIVVDVRSKEEYASGHVDGSINIPLPDLSANLHKVDIHKPVITCCASGMRSGSAKSLLKARGYTQVYNGGGWQRLQQKLNS